MLSWMRSTVRVMGCSCASSCGRRHADSFCEPRGARQHRVYRELPPTDSHKQAHSTLSLGRACLQVGEGLHAGGDLVAGGGVAQHAANLSRFHVLRHASGWQVRVKGRIKAWTT